MTSNSMTLPPSFTDAHRRALEWLRESGDWKNQGLDMPSNGLNSLAIRGLAESVSDKYFTRWRLTPAGIELMKMAKE